MTIHFNTYRFGPDEDALGRLINGDIPDEDETRWNMVDAPRYRIQKLLDEHLRAQAALRDCRDTGRPFVLFLRSFASEARAERHGSFYATHVITGSTDLQQWIEDAVEGVFPVVRLHGGSDGLLGGIGVENDKILSTHSDNWEQVARELIEAASAIVFLVSHVTAGVAREFEIIRSSGQAQHCLVLVEDPDRTPNKTSADPERLKTALSDFPHVFEMPADGLREAGVWANLKEKFRSVFRRDGTKSRLEETLSAPFNYLDRKFIESDDFRQAQTFLWSQMRIVRAVLHRSYWDALREHGVNYEHFDFGGAWKTAHQLYGIAVATSDFKAVQEALSYLAFLNIHRGADLALLVYGLPGQYEKLAAQIYPSGIPDNEAQYADRKDVLSMAPSTGRAFQLHKMSKEAAHNGDMAGANHLAHVAVLFTLRASDDTDQQRLWILANMVQDWAGLQTATAADWSLVNFEFALKLFRDLAADGDSAHLISLATCSRNLGSVQFGRRNYALAETGFGEAIEISRRLAPASDEALQLLSRSLSDMGQMKIATGDFEAAAPLVMEALAIGERRIAAHADAIADVTRFRALLSMSLANLPARREEAIELAWLAADNLPRATQAWPRGTDFLRGLVDDALRVTLPRM